MVSQPARMDWRRDELVADGVHFQEWRHFSSVPIVVSVGSTGSGRYRFRLAGDEVRVQLAPELVHEEGVGEACKVGTSSNATSKKVWLNVDGFEQFLGLKAYD